jgi:hypothetical protein
MSSSIQPVLCDFCKPIATIATRVEKVRDIPYHGSLEALKASALNGCVFCMWILENLPKFGISKLKSLQYIVGTGPTRQHFSLKYLIENSKYDYSKLQGPFHSSDNLGICFEGFYCNGRLSLLLTPNPLGKANVITRSASSLRREYLGEKNVSGSSRSDFDGSASLDIYLRKHT